MRATQFLEAFWEVRCGAKQAYDKSKERRSAVWCPPCSGQVKVNVDVHAWGRWVPVLGLLYGTVVGRLFELVVAMCVLRGQRMWRS